MDFGSEWKHFGQEPFRKFDVILKSLKDHFDDESYYLVRGRTNSFQLNTQELTNSLKLMAGNERFEVWSNDLKSVMEFAPIGVFRVGSIE